MPKINNSTSETVLRPKVLVRWYVLFGLISLLPVLLEAFFSAVFGREFGRVGAHSGKVESGMNGYFLAVLIVITPILVFGHLFWSQLITRVKVTSNGLSSWILFWKMRNFRWNELSGWKVRSVPFFKIQAFDKSNKIFSLPATDESLEAIHKFGGVDLSSSYSVARRNHSRFDILRWGILCLIIVVWTFTFLGKYRDTFMLAGALKGKIKLIKIGMVLGADVDGLIPSPKAPQKGITALIVSVSAKRSRAVEYLLAKGANVNIADTIHGRTPLFYAAKNGDLDTIQILKSHGAIVDALDYEGRRPIDFVDESQCKLCIKELDVGFKL